MKSDELREKYLAFFESKGCVRRPSDVLVPRWDPSVLFTPAGMNQFKDHFLGRCKLEFTRATTCQKCLRTGDIENVGRTAYHHTFFEMLGNFSFGDYFKREAIHWAWEFLTGKQWLGLAPERLSATVYLDDDEAAAVWGDEIGLPPERVGRLGEDENFWPANAPSQGPDGVCGPCSEIYYHSDFGEVEIWNLVFTQFHRVGPPPDNLRPLPSKNIDTGMGFERTAAVLQNVETNFHIDILLPIVQAAAEVCRVPYQPQSETGRRLRRITDHVRACTFAIHENVQPGPKKQGYVIKRLLRRAVLDGHQMGVREPFLHKLVGAVAQMMKQPYPELQETADRVAKIIQAEEENFLGTIDAGLDRIRRMFQEMAAQNRSMVSGQEAAEMFQTHGFPPELFEAMAAERNLLFDWDGFHLEMEQHGIDSGGGKKAELFTRSALDAIRTVNPPTRFLGYDTIVETDARVIGIIANGQLVDALEETGDGPPAAETGHDRPVVVVLDKTPFYGEMGGQVGDVGEISAEGLRFEVAGTTIEHGFIQHHGHLRQGSLALGARVTARVDEGRRQAIRRAHSATHLLHLALHKHVGKHALQQGSKVDTDLLRFDFANPKGLTAEQLAAVEDEVNRLVMAGLAVTCKNLPLAEARKLGAMMLFGEMYPDVVRVVTMGQSKELCGGTHLENTGQIGLLKIVGEESVAAGVRRITALTGPAALEHVHRVEVALAKTASLLKVPPEEVPARVESLVKEVRELKKKTAAAPKSGGPTVEQLLAEAADVGGVRVVIAEVPDATPQLLRDLIDQLRRKASPSAVLLGTRQGAGKVLLVAGVSRDLVAKGIDAVKWVTVAAREVGGGGGGRPDLAQAGGKDAAKLPEALAAARKEIEGLLAR